MFWNTCAICEKPGSSVALPGGVHEYLCHRHWERWDAFCAGHPTYKALRKAEIRKEIAIYEGRTEGAYTAEADFTQLWLDMFSVGKQWVLDQQLEAVKRE